MEEQRSALLRRFLRSRRGIRSMKSSSSLKSEQLGANRMLHIGIQTRERVYSGVRHGHAPRRSELINANAGVYQQTASQICCATATSC